MHHSYQNCSILILYFIIGEEPHHGFENNKKLISLPDKQSVKNKLNSFAASKFSISSKYNVQNTYYGNNSNCGELYIYEDTVAYIGGLQILESSSKNVPSFSDERYFYLFHFLFLYPL